MNVFSNLMQLFKGSTPELRNTIPRQVSTEIPLSALDPLYLKARDTYYGLKESSPNISNFTAITGTNQNGITEAIKLVPHPTIPKAKAFKVAHTSGGEKLAFVVDSKGITDIKGKINSYGDLTQPFIMFPY